MMDVELKRAKQRIKSKTYYHKTNKKVSVHCLFCNADHVVRYVGYLSNILKNGRFICIFENGHIVGKKAKEKKINPYALEGKKQCNGCKEVLPFEEFSKDPNKQDGYCTMCKKCRRERANKRYHAKFIDRLYHTLANLCNSAT